MTATTGMAARREVLANIVFDPFGAVVSIVGLSSADALAAHTWLGNHVLGCCDECCPCWQAGYERGLEAQRRPLGI